MSYNGSGTFNINTSGQPVVAGTVITASAFNALTTDLATGLTTAITKDGQTTTTARITFAQGITSSLVTDSSSVSTGSIITAGGAGIAKNLYVGVNANVAGTLGVTGVATFSAAPIYSSLTASSAVATDASKGLVSVTNTGTGNNVLATSPTITTPTISSLSSASATALTLQSAGTTAVTVDTSQNVGIGTASPSTYGKFVTYSSGGYSAFTTDGQIKSYQLLDVATAGGRLTGGSSQGVLGDIGIEQSTTGAKGGYLRFGTCASGSNSPTDRMIIYSNGLVKVVTTGTTAPTYSFTNYGEGLMFSNGDNSGSRYSDIVSLANTPAGATSNMRFWTNEGGGAGTATEKMRIDSSGNLLVGLTSSTATPAQGVVLSMGSGSAGVYIGHANGTSSGNFYMAYSYNGSAIGSITQNGTTGVLFNITSDYRLKNNPVALTGAKDFVMALQPKKWQWWDGSGEGVGFIAHEFMEVAKYSGNGEKDAVDADGKPIHQSIQPSSSEVMANIVALMQEQQALIDTQAETINALTARIVALESK